MRRDASQGGCGGHHRGSCRESRKGLGCSPCPGTDAWAADPKGAAPHSSSRGSYTAIASMLTRRPGRSAPRRAVERAGGSS